jgi:hypothetical protein
VKLHWERSGNRSVPKCPLHRDTNCKNVLLEMKEIIISDIRDKNHDRIGARVSNGYSKALLGGPY